MHVCAGIPQLVRHITIAGDDTCRLTRAGREDVRRNFACVLGVNAETKAYAQLRGHALGNLRRSMREISMNAGNSEFLSEA